MRQYAFLTAAAISVFCLGITSTAAKMNKQVTVHTLPDTGVVMLYGTVQKVNTPQEFILRDDSGAVAVRSTSEHILNEGDSVSITGTVKNRDVYASRIAIDARGGA